MMLWSLAAFGIGYLAGLVANRVQACADAQRAIGRAASRSQSPAKDTP